MVQWLSVIIKRNKYWYQHLSIDLRTELIITELVISLVSTISSHELMKRFQANLVRVNLTSTLLEFVQLQIFQWLFKLYWTGVYASHSSSIRPFCHRLLRPISTILPLKPRLAEEWRFVRKAPIRQPSWPRRQISQFQQKEMKFFFRASKAMKLKFCRLHEGRLSNLMLYNRKFQVIYGSEPKTWTLFNCYFWSCIWSYLQLWTTFFPPATVFNVCMSCNCRVKSFTDPVSQNPYHNRIMVTIAIGMSSPTSSVGSRFFILLERVIWMTFCSNGSDPTNKMNAKTDKNLSPCLSNYQSLKDTGHL